MAYNSHSPLGINIGNPLESLGTKVKERFSFGKNENQSRQVCGIPFRQPWQYKVAFDPDPKIESFDFYVVDVSYGSIDVESDEVSIGSVTLAEAKKTNAPTITVTFRDDTKLTIHNWLIKWYSEMFTEDGLVNLPIHYVKTINIFFEPYAGAGTSKQKLDTSKKVYIESITDPTLSYANREEFYTFSVTFKSARSINASTGRKISGDASGRSGVDIGGFL